MMRFVQKKHLEENVVFRGWLGREEMLTAYQSAHVHIVTSHKEAMSMSVLESLSAGTFLMATDAGGNARLIQNQINGLLIPENNATELAQAMEWYYNEKFLTHYSVSDEVLNQFRRNYDWENIIQLYNSLLKNVVK